MTGDDDDETITSTNRDRNIVIIGSTSIDPGKLKWYSNRYWRRTWFVNPYKQRTNSFRIFLQFNLACTEIYFCNADNDNNHNNGTTTNNTPTSNNNDNNNFNISILNWSIIWYQNRQRKLKQFNGYAVPSSRLGDFPIDDLSSAAIALIPAPTVKISSQSSCHISVHYQPGAGVVPRRPLANVEFFQ